MLKQQLAAAAPKEPKKEKTEEKKEKEPTVVKYTSETKPGDKKGDT